MSDNEWFLVLLAVLAAVAFIGTVGVDRLGRVLEQARFRRAMQRRR
jgi:hypothetical protein